MGRPKLPPLATIQITRILQRVCASVTGGFSPVGDGTKPDIRNMWLLVDDKLAKTSVRVFTEILTLTSSAFRIQIGLTLPCLERLITVTSKISHAPHESTGLATSEPGNTSFLDGFCEPSTVSHP